MLPGRWHSPNPLARYRLPVDGSLKDAFSAGPRPASEKRSRPRSTSSGLCLCGGWEDARSVTRREAKRWNVAGFSSTPKSRRKKPLWRYRSYQDRGRLESIPQAPSALTCNPPRKRLLTLIDAEALQYTAKSNTSNRMYTPPNQKQATTLSAQFVPGVRLLVFDWTACFQSRIVMMRLAKPHAASLLINLKLNVSRTELSRAQGLGKEAKPEPRTLTWRWPDPRAGRWLHWQCESESHWQSGFGLRIPSPSQ
eukprot:2116943-Rhodomonas_salina.3